MYEVTLRFLKFHFFEKFLKFSPLSFFAGSHEVSGSDGTVKSEYELMFLTQLPSRYGTSHKSQNC